MAASIPGCMKLMVLPMIVFAVSSALAAEMPIRMTTPTSIAHEVAAMPRIAEPTDEAQRTINAAVARLDGGVRKAIADCRAQGGKDADWSRGITTPMLGPRFLSYVISDSRFCGGAHPDTSTMSIVYDLQSGKPVDWTKLLPPALTGKLALADGMDGTKMVTLSSPTLYALYLTGYRHSAEDASHQEDRDCHDAVAQADASSPPTMMAWLDAKAEGLAVQFDLAHVVQACADPVVIPMAALKVLGAQPVLTDAIASAHDGVANR